MAHAVRINISFKYTVHSQNDQLKSIKFEWIEANVNKILNNYVTKLELNFNSAGLQLYSCKNKAYWSIKN